MRLQARKTPKAQGKRRTSLQAKADQLHESLVYDLTQTEIEAATETEIQRTQEVLQEVEMDDSEDKKWQENTKDAAKRSLKLNVSPKEKYSPSATGKRKGPQAVTPPKRKNKRVVEETSSEDSDPSWEETNAEKSETDGEDEDERPLQPTKRPSKKSRRRK